MRGQSSGKPKSNAKVAPKIALLGRIDANILTWKQASKSRMSMPTISSVLLDNDRIDSWKAIANFFGRDERTVKRWEKERALPVQRVPGKRGGVFAYKRDLSRWLNSSTVDRRVAHLVASSDRALEMSANQAGAPSPDELPSPQDPIAEVTLQAQEPPQIALGQSPSRPEFLAKVLSLSWLLALAIAGTAAILIAARHARHTESVQNPPLTATVPIATKVIYSSKVAGVDDLYLQGVYLYEQRTPESVRHALSNFQEAIGKDPGYAPAYAGLANSYNLGREYLLLPASEAYPKAAAAAQKAIALDKNLAQAHSALGFAEFFGFWQAAAAEREFKTAIALEPGASLPHLWYGSMLTHEARYPEAIEQLNLAYRLQPSSTAISSSRALALGLGGRRDEGADLLQQIINADRNAPSAHLRLALLSLLEPRDVSRFIEESRRRAELTHDKTLLNLVTVSGRAYRSSGEVAMWQTILREEHHHHPSQVSWLMAESETALGHKDAAIADLEALRKQHDCSMVAIEMDPVLLPLHHDPRFQHIVAAAGLPIHN